MAVKTSDFPAKQRQINDDIASGNFKPCYLLYGDEAYLRLQNKDKLIKAMGVDASSMNFTRYEGDGCNPAEIIDMAETMPFLADRRVILVENSGFFKSGCPELADYLKNPSETTFFIFVEFFYVTANSLIEFILSVKSICSNFFNGSMRGRSFQNEHLC